MFQLGVKERQNPWGGSVTKCRYPNGSTHTSLHISFSPVFSIAIIPVLIE